MTMQISSKLPHVGTNIFTIMSQMAMQHNAINLSQGFPSFATPEPLRELVYHYMNEGFNQYPPMMGIPKLRQQLAAKTAQLYGRTVSPDNEITICTGASEGLFSAISAVVSAGDEVILFDPAFDCYQPIVELNGGRAVHIPLTSPDYRFDWQQLRDTITPKTRLIILNSPHNPTGTTLSATDLDTLAEITRDSNILILSDEVYEHIIFDGQTHQSILCHAELAERALVISSFGKTYHATGWKIGYCIAPPALTTEFRRIHQFVTFSVMTPMQYALADFLEQSPEYYLNLSAFYQQKRDTFCYLLEESRFKFTPTQGTFFQLLDYSNITDQSDVEYARYLTREVGVASIPISVFYEQPPQEHVLRFCFAKDDETLQKAARRLCEI